MEPRLDMSAVLSAALRKPRRRPRARGMLLSGRDCERRTGRLQNSDAPHLEAQLGEAQLGDPPGDFFLGEPLPMRGGDTDDSVLLHWPTPSRPHP